MVKKTFTISNAQGFHMRPASSFATAMMKYPCNVTISFNDKQINAKSLMNIMAACIKVGSVIDVICDGDKENEALAEAGAMIENGFGE